MLIKLYTNQIKETSSEAENTKLNIFNMFVSHSSNKEYMEELYLSSFKYMENIELEVEVEKEIDSLKIKLNDEVFKFNTLIEENQEYVWEKFSEEFILERNTKEHKLSDNIKNLEQEILFNTQKLKQYNFYFTLNFDFYVYFLKYHYPTVKADFLHFLKNMKNKKILYIISYYLAKHKLKIIIIDLINELSLSKELCSLFTKTYDYNIIIQLIKKHSSKIVNFAIIYQILIQNRISVIEDLKIEDIKNVHIKYIYEHLKKTQPQGLS